MYSSGTTCQFLAEILSSPPLNHRDCKIQPTKLSSEKAGITKCYIAKVGALGLKVEEMKRFLVCLDPGGICNDCRGQEVALTTSLIF